MTARDWNILMENPTPLPDVDAYVALAKKLADQGDFQNAASAMDRAYGLHPARFEAQELRTQILERLSVRNGGVLFRYIPAGWFLMGSDEGDLDEAPVHALRTGDYWLSETTVSWSEFCRIMALPPPPDEIPTTDLSSAQRFRIHEAWKIRLQYCEDKTVRAQSWHAHVPSVAEYPGQEKMFGPGDSIDTIQRFRYDQKPLIAVSCQEAEAFCERMPADGAIYRLPTEAEWEKAARGGLVNARYAWGNDPPTKRNCDFDQFDEFSIKPFKTYPPNGYGLYAMCGSVWEWTAEVYDPAAYTLAGSAMPQNRAAARVLRGGSWADCAEAVTVSFRMSRRSPPWDAESNELPERATPNIGFRICRTLRR